MNRERGRHAAAGGQSGFALYVALMVLLVVGAVAGFVLQAAYQQSHEVRRWHEADQCLLDAQSALERVKYDLAQYYRTNETLPLAWFENWTSNSLGMSPAYWVPSLASIGGSAVDVTIGNVTVRPDALTVDIELVGAARRGAPPAPARRIRETLRLFVRLADSRVPVFDYGYFVYHNGLVAGASTLLNGDVRVNGNLRLRDGPRINGDVYAAGVINGSRRSLSLADYWNPVNTGPAARPSDPTGANGIAWPMGYDPGANRTVKAPLVRMPLIGDLDFVAAAANGRLTLGGIVVERVYEGPGPDGLTGTADDGCLVLDGTVSPIVLRGPVVVRGDVVLRGRVSGQGTIYAGRNLHIVGDLSYVNPPAWPKPDSNPAATASSNAARDLLIMAAKGNIVVGNYASAEWSNRVWNILADPTVIQSYAVEASDASLGYDSDADPANGYHFDGRFFVQEAHGGRRLSGTGTNTVPRRYYESSLSDAAIRAVSDPNNVPRIEAALFSNHAIIGNWGSSAPGGNTLLNGAMAARAELGNFYGSFTLNWDIRLGTASRDRVTTHLVAVSESDQPPVTIGWREIHQ